MIGSFSALTPAGVQAARIAELWWILLAVAVVVWVLVVSALIVAVFRGHRAPMRPVDDEAHGHAPARLVEEDPATMRRTGIVIGVATSATVLTVFVLLVLSFTTGRALSSLPTDDALMVTITGHQFWWEIEYEDPSPPRAVKTANELHIPVGRPVLLNLLSRDVIHSFWVPSLHGKMDLIPGIQNQTSLRADRAGVYRGQCAEFCGFQHAHMGLLVVAEPPEVFARWLDGQRAPANEPGDDATRTGRHVLENTPCVMCHTVRGTEANGTVGPDLTHLASRRTLAAGTLPNTRGHLAGWMLDPQQIKPGVNMPANSLRPDELNALLEYLESLT